MGTGEQVMVLEGENTRHLMDLRLATVSQVGVGRRRQGLGQQEVQGSGCAGELGEGEHVEKGGGEVGGGSLRILNNYKYAIV